MIGRLGAFASRFGRSAGARGISSFARSSTGVGAMAGAGWGAMSSDTSVVGGAMMGAGAGRYGAAGLRMAGRGGAGQAFGAHAIGAGRRFGLGALGAMRRDFRGGRKLASNMARNGFSGMKSRFGR